MNETSQRFKIIAATAVLCLALAGLAVFFWFDPAQHAIFPVCPFHRLTGLNCPGCGGLRALHHLAHGRWLTAFHHNPLVVVALPVVILIVARASRLYVSNRTGETPVPLFWRPLWFVALAVVVILFGVLRNLPFAAFAWMSP